MQTKAIKLFSHTLFFSLFFFSILISFSSNPVFADGSQVCNNGYISSPAGCVPKPSCPTGYVFDGYCKPIQCSVGQTLNGGTCQPIQCPTGQTLNGNTCQPIQCPTGQTLNGNTCQPIQCPTGQTLNGNTCQPIQCPVGQVLNGSVCQPIQCPAGTQFDGSQCVPIQCAPNQILQANGCQTINDAYWGCRYTGGFWSVFSNRCHCPASAPWNGYLCRGNSSGAYTGAGQQQPKAQPSSPSQVSAPINSSQDTYNSGFNSSNTSSNKCSSNQVRYNGQCVTHMQKFCLQSPARLAWVNGRCQFKARTH